MTESHKYKIILLGEVGVGKTSLFCRIMTGRFHDNQSTLQGDCFEKSMMVDGDEIRVSFYHMQDSVSALVINISSC